MLESAPARSGWRGSGESLVRPSRLPSRLVRLADSNSDLFRSGHHTRPDRIQPPMQCASCRREIPASSRFCSECGAAVGATDGPTIAASPGPPRPPSTDPIDQARFIPGTMLASRYRIVSLIGRGGMGEVYRAEDLKLAQAVALKFLPEEFARSAERLARFHQEVRMARQVSHPNVCRVYDIGEAEGLQ